MFFVPLLIFMFQSQFTSMCLATGFSLVAKFIDFILSVGHMLEITRMHVQKTVMRLTGSLELRHWARDFLKQLPIIFCRWKNGSKTLIV